MARVRSQQDPVRDRGPAGRRRAAGLHQDGGDGRTRCALDRVDIESPGFSGIHQTCHVRNRAWISFPEPFTEGMTITATWHRGSRVLFTCESEPLRKEALRPIFGPDWTSYGSPD